MAAGYLCTHHSPYSSIITVVRRYHCGYSLGLRSTDRHLFANHQFGAHCCAVQNAHDVNRSH